MATCRTSFTTVSVALFLLAVLTGNAFADDSTDIIARFEGSGQQNVGGKNMTVVGLNILTTGRTVMSPIPMEKEKEGKDKEKMVPKKELVDAVKKLTKGQVVKASVMTKDGTLVSIDPYDSKPGEDTPNGYVFAKSFDNDKTHTTAVVVTKYGVERTLNVPMHKGDKGQEPDADIAATVAKLQEGAPVWVQASGKNLVAIEPYADPQTGKVAKLGEAEIDGHKVKSADIETDAGKTVTVLVPGKVNGKAFTPDSMVLAEFSKVKAGAQVEFRVHEDGDKLWLREITLAKPAPKKPMEKEAPAKK